MEKGQYNAFGLVRGRLKPAPGPGRGHFLQIQRLEGAVQ